MIVRGLYTIKEYFHRQKNWLKNCFKYKNALERTYDFDYGGTLHYMREHFGHISDAMKNGSYLQENDKDRIPKEEDLDRIVELIYNMMQDNFADRCGYDDNFEVTFVEDGNEEYMTSKSTITDAQRENNTQALEGGVILEEREWKEFLKLLKGMKTWWI